MGASALLHVHLFGRAVKEGHQAPEIIPTKLTAVLVKAVKELKAENDRQKRENQRQQAEIEELRSIIKELKS
jgi:hypothetical protein